MKFEHWWASKHPAAIDEAGFALLREAWAEAATAEREACVGAIQRLIDGGLNCHAVDCIEAIRLRGAAL